MKIIDFHTHPFLKNEHNTCFYKNIVEKNNFKTIIEKAGISQICGSVIHKTNNFEDIKLLNKESLLLKDLWKNFYIPGIHIHPDFPEESIKEIKYMNKKGIKLIGELVPYYNGWNKYYSKNLHYIYEEINKTNMTISLHTDFNTDMDILEKAVNLFPNIKFVAAHPNQKDLYFKHIELLNKYENYFLDLSGSGLFRYGMLTNLIKHCSSEKILFGTDFPICNPKMYIEAIFFENLKEKDIENIMYKNAENLLNLNN